MDNTFNNHKDARAAINWALVNIAKIPDSHTSNIRVSNAIEHLQEECNTIIEQIKSGDENIDMTHFK